MSTALIVREEYWDKQLDTKLKIMNFNINADTIKRYGEVCEKFIYELGKRSQQWVENMVEIGRAIINGIQKGLESAINALLRLFKNCDVSSADNFDTVCNKFENRMIYLNRQKYINQEQYYKSQFKLAKTNYYNRRC